MNNTGDETAYAGPGLVNKIVECVIISFICVIAIIGNVSIWIIVCRMKKLRTVTNAFILGLSVADLLVSVINMPLTVYTIAVGSWVLSDTACTSVGFINMLTLVTSVLSLCNISINRFVMVVKPSKFKKIYTRINATFMMIAVVVVSILLSSPPLYGWGEYDYIPIQSFCFCNWSKDMSYAFFMIGACFGVPLSVMLVCNVCIVKEVRKSRRRVKTVMSSTISTSSGTALIPKPLSPERSVDGNGNDGNLLHPTWRASRTTAGATTDTGDIFQIKPNEKSSVKDVNVKIDAELDNIKRSPNSKPRRNISQTVPKPLTEEVRLALSLAVVVLCFVLCWLPYCISMVLSIFVPEFRSREFHMFTLVIGYSNSCCNPIIYGLMNKRFGDGFRYLYCRCCKQNEVSITTTSSMV